MTKHFFIRLMSMKCWYSDLTPLCDAYGQENALHTVNVGLGCLYLYSERSFVSVHVHLLNWNRSCCNALRVYFSFQNRCYYSLKLCSLFMGKYKVKANCGEVLTFTFHRLLPQFPLCTDFCRRFVLLYRVLKLCLVSVQTINCDIPCREITRLPPTWDPQPFCARPLTL